jgi:hypothetical protein
MAKKQTRRSISVSRVTYERLKAFCEANNISMSQLVETRVNDFLGDQPAVAAPPRPVMLGGPPSIGASINGPSNGPSNGTSNGSSAFGAMPQRPSAPMMSSPPVQKLAPVTPMTSAAARIAVEPPPPIIKQKQQEPAPKPTEKRPDQIFTF